MNGSVSQASAGEIVIVIDFLPPSCVPKNWSASARIASRSGDRSSSLMTVSL
jgi:hypothetical protein